MFTNNQHTEGKQMSYRMMGRSGAEVRQHIYTYLYPESKVLMPSLDVYNGR